MLCCAAISQYCCLRVEQKLNGSRPARGVRKSTSLSCYTSSWLRDARECAILSRSVKPLSAQSVLRGKPARMRVALSATGILSVLVPLLVQLTDFLLSENRQTSERHGLAHKSTCPKRDLSRSPRADACSETDRGCPERDGIRHWSNLNVPALIDHRRRNLVANCEPSVSIPRLGERHNVLALGLLSLAMGIGSWSRITVPLTRIYSSMMLTVGPQSAPPSARVVWRTCLWRAWGEQLSSLRVTPSWEAWVCTIAGTGPARLRI